MKELIAYLTKHAAWLLAVLAVILFGAAGITGGLATPAVVDLLEASKNDAPLIVTETATPPIKSGYDFGGLPSATPTGPYEFTDHAPPKVSVLPKGLLYYGHCEPHVLEVTFAPGTENTAKHVLGIDLVVHLLDAEGAATVQSSTSQMIFPPGADPYDEVGAAEYVASVYFLAAGDSLPITVPNAIITGLDFGVGSLPSKLSLAFVLHFQGAPDEELWLIEMDGGDPVVVSFEAGDVHQPYVISLYACPSEPVATPTRTEKEKEIGPRDRRTGG